MLWVHSLNAHHSNGETGHKQISTYLAVKHKQKCLPTGCSRGLNGSAFSRISTAVAQLHVGT